MRQLVGMVWQGKIPRVCQPMEWERIWPWEELITPWLKQLELNMTTESTTTMCEMWTDYLSVNLVSQFNQKKPRMWYFIELDSTVTETAVSICGKVFGRSPQTMFYFTIWLQIKCQKFFKLPRKHSNIRVTSCARHYLKLKLHLTCKSKLPGVSSLLKKLLSLCLVQMLPFQG